MRLGGNPIQRGGSIKCLVPKLCQSDRGEASWRGGGSAPPAERYVGKNACATTADAISRRIKYVLSDMEEKELAVGPEIA